MGIHSRFHLCSVLPLAIVGAATAASDFDWSTLQPSKTLNWTDCYSTPFQCTRFTVPLNYSEPTGTSAALALIRYPANVTDPKQYMGPILFNPGGPGGSGVDQILQRGDQFATVIGPQFDMVGFDPRGVENSTPGVAWFESEIEASLWSSAQAQLTASTQEDFTRMWSRSHVVGALAEERDLEGVSHLNTENVARDMLLMTEAYGYEKLQYWGFSYGTILGVTFASMFPDKVGRMVLDGVVDPEDYYSGGYETGIQDADKSFDLFFQQCAASTIEDCPFWSATPEEISGRLDNLYKSMRDEPLVVMSTGTGYGYDIVDYSTLRIAVTNSMYNPYASFLTLAQGLKDLESGNGTLILSISRGTVTKLECDSLSSDPVLADISTAIYCSDAQEPPDSPAQLQAKYLNMTQYSSFADFWIAGSGRCLGWRVRDPNRYLGPFGSNATQPILFIGNILDSATPIRYARNVAASFNGSVILTQNSGGHTSIAAPSVCTSNHVQAYFVEGKLPDENTVCEVTGPVFKAASAAARRGDMEVPRNVPETRLLKAINGLSRNTGVAHLNKW